MVDSKVKYLAQITTLSLNLRIKAIFHGWKEKGGKTCDIESGLHWHLYHI